MPSINTRADLDALTGTSAHTAFMAALAGSIYRLEKDDAAKMWRSVQDTSAIERFGLTLADFPGVQAPPPPAYVSLQPTVPTSVTMRQARLALARAGLLVAVNAAVAAGGETLQIEWEFAATVDRTWPTLATLQVALGLTDAQVDALFVIASGL